MLTLIRNAHVFAPRALGRRDVLLAGERIMAVEESISLAGQEITEIDARNHWLLPGFVDALTHPCGGGGEGGFGNRTGELDALDFIRGGVTTPVGALGTDSIARNLETLFGQTMKLRTEGLSALMYSGSYRVPLTTLTGDIARDLVLVAPVIGAGEIAIADHRGSHPSNHELRRLASDIALGGTLSGKGGVLLLHLGDGSGGLNAIEEVLASSELPRRLLFPTHVNRQARLLDQAISHMRAGGFADITVSTTPEFVEAGEVTALDALHHAIHSGAPSSQVSFSSDAGGSLPLYREGELAGLQAAPANSLLCLMQEAIATHGEPPVDVLAAMTINPANALGLVKHGRIAAGANASLLLLSQGDGQLKDVFCKGKRLMQAGEISLPD